MAKLIYRNVPYNTAAGVGVVILTDDMDPHIRQQWLDALKGYNPAPLPYTPTFRLAFGTDGINTWPLDTDDFATSETAQAMADKYGTGEVVEVPYGGSGGLYTASQKEFHIKLKDGRLKNAGLIAAFYIRNPEDQFPALADKLIRSALANGV